MKPKAVKTKFRAPYIYDGKYLTALPCLRHDKQQSGVYLIKSNRTGKIIYIGHSQSNLYKTIYRHFQTWKDISRTIKTRYTYNKIGYTVRIIFTTASRAALLEKYLIQKMQPRDNEIKYDLFLSDNQNTRAKEILTGIPTVLKDSDLPF